MTNTIIHGDNTVLSRQKLSAIIKQNRQQGVKEVIRLSGDKLDQTALKQALETQSLFGDHKLVVIETLPVKLTDSLASSSSNLVIWDKKILTKTVLNKLSNFNVLLFKTPAAIFKFLDYLTPNNPKSTLSVLHQDLKSVSPELVFYMLSRRLSQLILASDHKATSLLKGAPWQKSRLISQAKNFSLNQLISLHRRLLKIDYDIKTGRSGLPLSSQLDLFLAKL